MNRCTKSHKHGDSPRSPNNPPSVDVSFLAGDYVKDGRATVRMRIVDQNNKTLGSVDLLADQAWQVSYNLSEIAAEVATTECRP